MIIGRQEDTGFGGRIDEPAIECDDRLAAACELSGGGFLIVPGLMLATACR
jgi:hypothetical protein